ncbi:MAG: hypothetical protein ICV60_05750 [Pyrinomonadaceae bacterium]|nr:hypothetical protein [Pyrinomonadaceae bacterium]
MLWSFIKDWLAASLRRVGGMELPDMGRSSVEGTLSDRLAGAMSGFGTVSPYISFEMLALLKRFSVFNPDFSQYVQNIINLANTGHKIVVDAPSSQRAEAAVTRLNEAASRLYENAAGVDGLFNAYFNQIAVYGAVSSEDVVDFGGRRVKKVVIVPVEQIRFQYLDDEYVPHQQPNSLLGLQRSPLGLIRLNPETYHYYALQTIENSPYARPPGSAAVDAIVGPQTDMLENLKYIARKFGILGFISLLCAPPSKKANETEDEWFARSQRYLKKVAKASEGNLNKGLLVTFNNQKPTHHSVTADGRGFYDVWRTNEEQVMSGLAQQPVFFGRTDSTTETFADVVYNLLLSQAGNIQRLGKRRHEATCRLDLRLGGIEVDGLSVQFNRAHARDPLKEAQADQIRFQVTKEKAECGMISPDEAAQECGYDSAYDPELIAAAPELAQSLRRMHGGAGHASQFRATFRFNRDAQRYQFVPQRIELMSAPVEADDNVFSLKKKRAA